MKRGKLMSHRRCVAVPSIRIVLPSFLALNRKHVRRVAFGVLLATLALLSVVTYASASTLVVRRRLSPTIGGRSPFWSWNFESGTQWAASGPLPQFRCGNNPGQVVTTLPHTGTRSGYYYVSDPNSNDPCAAFPARDFVSYSSNPNGAPTLATHDFYYEVWVYIPSQTINGWMALATTEYANWATGIMVDSTADRKLYFWSTLAAPDGPTGYYQTGAGIQWSFDKWFKIGVEVHADRVILYQDDQQILQVTLHQSASAMVPWMFHWGLYVGSGQNHNFKIYNDDIALYDLT